MPTLALCAWTAVLADPFTLPDAPSSVVLGRGKRAVHAYAVLPTRPLLVEIQGPTPVRLLVYGPAASSLALTLVRDESATSRNDLKLRAQGDLPKGQGSAALAFTAPAGVTRFRIQVDREAAIGLEAVARRKTDLTPAPEVALAAPPEAKATPEPSPAPPVATSSVAASAAPGPAQTAAKTPSLAASPAGASGALAVSPGSAATGASRPTPADVGDDALSVALMGLHDGGVGAQTVASLTSVVADTLSRTGAFRVITTADIQAMLTLEASRQMMDCDAESCFAEIGAALGVGLLVSGSINQVQNTTLVALQLIAPDDGKIIARESQEVQDRAALLEAVRDTTRRLVRSVLAERLGYLALRSNEEGASVFIDNVLEGVTPARQLLVPMGRHALRVEKAGFITSRSEVVVAKDQATAVEIVLIPSREFIDAYETQAKALRYTSYGAMVAAAGLLGVGGYFVIDARERAGTLRGQIEAFNGNPEDPAEATRLEQARLNLNQGYVLGQGLLFAGLAAGVAAAVLFFIGDDPDRYGDFTGVSAPAEAATEPASTP